MVPNDFIDDEADEFFPEFWVEIGFSGKISQPGDLLFFTAGIGRRQVRLSLVLPDRLGDPETFGKNMHEGGVDIVNGSPVSSQYRVFLGVRRAAQRTSCITCGFRFIPAVLTTVHAAGIT